MRLQVSVIIPAAGKGARLKARLPKALVLVGRIPLFIHTIRQLTSTYRFNEIVVPIRRQDQSLFAAAAKRYRLRRIRFIEGGSSRAASVWRGLKALKQTTGLVLVHDMARPFVPKRDVQALVRRTNHTGACILALPATATVKEVGRALNIRKTLDRSNIYLAQTPQAFRVRVLNKVYRHLGKRAFNLTDEASLLEAAGLRVSVIEGSPCNFKITTPADLKLAETMLKDKRKWQRH